MVAGDARARRSAFFTNFAKSVHRSSCEQRVPHLVSVKRFKKLNSRTRCMLHAYQASRQVKLGLCDEDEKAPTNSVVCTHPRGGSDHRPCCFQYMTFIYKRYVSNNRCCLSRRASSVFPSCMQITRLARLKSLSCPNNPLAMREPGEAIRVLVRQLATCSSSPSVPVRVSGSLQSLLHDNDPHMHG